jgi:DNA-binding CsgD family transcriptional regulator
MSRYRSYSIRAVHEPAASGRGNTPQLVGRRAECAALRALLEAVRSGESRPLVVRGGAGTGKTALLDYVATHASDCRVARIVAVQSEMELAFAGLHQLAAPMLERLGDLPEPQQDAMRVAVGISAGPAPDRFVLGLAALGLLSETAAQQPLVCLIDDAQWLDQASAHVLGFVARRLRRESVGLVFGSRGQNAVLSGLPELAVEGLPEADARELLDSVLTTPLDARVRDQIVAETRGNPLALLEVPRGLTVAELAGGFGLPGAVPVSDTIEESFRRRVGVLPAATRRLLLVAAADPTGDPALVWRAAGRLGIGADAAAPAKEAGLAEFGDWVRFRHPLARSAAYWSASAEERREVHAALAEVTDPQADPDRRAWHRAQAAPGPDEDVAAELELSAGRAQARGGLAAAAAFLERAAALTLDPPRRAHRGLAAAQAKVQAGALDEALDLLAAVPTGTLDELGRARADLLRAQVAYAQNRGSEAPGLLLRAAQALEPLDIRLARTTYLDALGAASFAGHSAGDVGIAEVARSVLAAPRPSQLPRPLDLLLEGSAAQRVDGYAVGVPMLAQALGDLRTGDYPADERLECALLTYSSAVDLWDDESWYALATRNVAAAREAGALTALQFALNARICADAFMGDMTAGFLLLAEMEAVCEATDSYLPPYARLALVAWIGREAEVTRLAELTTADVRERGEGMGLSAAQWALAPLYNSLGRHEEALVAAQRAGDYRDLGFSDWSVGELVLAAVRCGQPGKAEEALNQLAEKARDSGSDWAAGIEARSRALLSEGDTAERAYRGAIDRLSRTRVRTELARTHLLYGEWLRRQRRRADAAAQLRTASRMLGAMGLEGMAERARGELRLAGGSDRIPVSTSELLTEQETHVARLASDGLSNHEIGARLFISTRTVQYHLGKVFAKLGISSRGQLHRVLPDAIA